MKSRPTILDAHLAIQLAILAANIAGRHLVALSLCSELRKLERDMSPEQLKVAAAWRPDVN